MKIIPIHCNKSVVSDFNYNVCKCFTCLVEKLQRYPRPSCFDNHMIIRRRRRRRMMMTKMTTMMQTMVMTKMTTMMKTMMMTMRMRMRREASHLCQCRVLGGWMRWETLHSRLTSPPCTSQETCVHSLLGPLTYLTYLYPILHPALNTDQCTLR